MVRWGMWWNRLLAWHPELDCAASVVPHDLLLGSGFCRLHPPVPLPSEMGEDTQGVHAIELIPFSLAAVFTVTLYERGGQNFSLLPILAGHVVAREFCPFGL